MPACLAQEGIRGASLPLPLPLPRSGKESHPVKIRDLVALLYLSRKSDPCTNVAVLM